MPNPADLHSAHEIVVFTIGLIACMQALAWLRHREPGMAWFAVASLVTTGLVASGSMSLPRGAEPSVVALLLMYLVRALFAYGLSDYLGLSTRARAVVIGVLLLPEAVFALALVLGLAQVSLVAAAPLMWANLGLALACLFAARRDASAGLLLLATAPLVGPLTVAVDAWSTAGVRPGHNFTIAAIGFGVIVLVVDLMRKTRESRVAQAHAQRMSNYYAALSHTNQAIVRIKDPVALYNEICRICVASAQAKMACVYAVDGALARRVAAAGGAAHILATYPDPWHLDAPDSRHSFIVQAILDNERVVSNDYLSDPAAGRWRALALQHDLRAVAVLPLRRAGLPVAALMVVADEMGIFDAALVRLLDEMTGDISFALDNIEREARHTESVVQVEAGLERFTRLFQSAPVASAIIAIADRRLLDVNDAICALQGATREELVGRTTDSLAFRAVDEDRERFYATLQREGRVRNMVMRMSGDDGRSRIDLLNAEPIEHLGQRCLLLMSLDITDMRAAEEARRALVDAQAASDAKTTFLSRMSHELRTPLNAVTGFSGLLRDDAADRLTAPQLAQLDHVQQAGWHLARLIDDVLDLSRIEAGQFGVDSQSVALGPLLDDTLQMSQPMAAAAGITLQAAYHGQAPLRVLADPTRLRQVMLNLLSNAIKYNRAGGSVQVRAASEAGRVRIDVVDTGLGMSADQLAHLFEPFNRLGREREGFEGTGIGLALTRQLMQLMDGELQVRSEAGAGTHATLLLPDAAAQAAADAPGRREDARADPQALASRTGSVLYIEDNAVNTLLVEQLLARAPGVRFVAAPDGASGLQQAQSARPDLILLDLQLPDMDGLQVLDTLRATAALRDVPIVVLSASAMPDILAQARQRGATDYWTKPLDFQQFLAGVATLLPGRAARADEATAP